MKRRQVLTGLFAVTAVSLYPRSPRDASRHIAADDIEPPFNDPLSDHENRTVVVPASDVLVVPDKSISTAVDVLKESVHTPAKVNKNIHFEKDYADDIFVSAAEKATLHSVALRLKKLQSTVGYGNFNILSLDDALTFAKRFSQVGEFTPVEKDFIEKIFFFNAADYGFLGDKVVTSLSATIKKDATFKVPNTGHYLFKEQSFTYYEKIRHSVGEGIVLTSGIRSNVKQLHLFLAKVIRVKGNLSRASRSLAPPGYSYHGIGDFDVGRKGWGGKNFTDAFSKTDEFKRMQDLGYVAIRYDEGNQLGVRFEPWHIQVV